jgi:hypothetical protein
MKGGRDQLQEGRNFLRSGPEKAVRRSPADREDPDQALKPE